MLILIFTLFQLIVNKYATLDWENHSLLEINFIQIKDTILICFVYAYVEQ